ncbi:MAG: SDR family oxidoreductase [Pseudomonadota bacterium]
MPTALVTGAARRIGRAMALALGEDGYDVAVHYAGSADDAEAVVQTIQAGGTKAVALQADLTDEAQMQALLPRAVDALGPVTMLINNASIFEYDDIKTGTRASWDAHIESNLRAPVVLTQALAEQAPSAGSDADGEPISQAQVINLIDQRIHKLTPAFMSYTIAKMGLWAFTRTAAQALGPAIRVNAIGPGPTLQGSNQSEANFKRQRAATILERGANVEDIVAAMRYFMCAKAVTGQILCIDGGQHLTWKTADMILDV